VLARVPQGVHLCVAVQAGNLPSVPCSYPNLAYVPPSFVIFGGVSCAIGPYCSILYAATVLILILVPYVLHSCPWLLHDSHACLSLSLLAVTSELNQWSCKMTAIAICSLLAVAFFGVPPLPQSSAVY